MITSARNPKVQLVRSLQAHARTRQESGAFVVEGVRLVEEALASGWPARMVLYTPGIRARGLKLVGEYARQGVQVEQVSPAVLKSASATETPQGIIAALSMRPMPLPPRIDFVLILDGVRDPGNLGTVLRTASAAGVQAVLLAPGTTDAYAPKVVRSAMGAHFRLPVCPMTWDEIGAALHRGADQRPRVYLADARHGLPYTQVDFRSPLALILGGEAEGASSHAQALADERVHIPMPGGVESLNISAAAAILLFEALRQRQNST